MWVCFLQLFDPSTPKASNRDPTAREYFTRNHSYKNSFKQCKISYNLIKFCCIWEFKVSTESRDNFLCFCTLSMDWGLHIFLKKIFWGCGSFLGSAGKTNRCIQKAGINKNSFTDMQLSEINPFC